MNAPTENDTNNRGRRVTDKHGGILDAAHQAVQLKELEGDVKLLSGQMTGSIREVNNNIQSLQIESRSIATKLDAIASLQAQHDTNKETIARIEKHVDELGSRLERWFDDERAQRDDWQLRHEAENENNYRELQDKIARNKEVADERTAQVQSKLAWASGAAAIVVLLGGTIVGGFLWSINERFSTAANTMDKIATAVGRNADNIEELDDRVRDIEIYLARGGHNPNDPYTQPRKDDGKR